MEKRLEYKICQYEDAVQNFEESLSIDLLKYPEIVVDSLKSGRVQKFKFCVELLWKTLKVYLLEIHGIDSKSPKMVMKDFYNIDSVSVSDYEKMMAIIDDKNRLSNIYNKEQFDEIYQRVIKALPLFQKIRAFLKNQGSEGI